MYMVFRGGELHLGLLFCVVSLKREESLVFVNPGLSLFIYFFGKLIVFV